MRKIGVASLIAFGLASAALAPSAGAATDKLIDVRGNGAIRSFGLFNPNGDPSPTAASAALGAGTVLSDSDASCLIHYFSAGVGVLFADFGAPGVSACDPSAGKAQRLIASGAGWHTNRGLAIGSRLKRLKKLYREKRRGKARWELISKKSQIGPTGRQTVLSATVVDGGVIELEVFAGRAGE